MGDQAAAARELVEAVRAGELEPLRLEIAAALGHSAARLALGGEAPPGLDKSYDHKLTAAARFAGPYVAAAWAADALERALTVRSRNDESLEDVIEDVTALAQRLTTGEWPLADLEEIHQAAYDLQEAAPGFSPQKALADGAFALSVGMEYFDPARPDAEWLPLHATAAMRHAAAFCYRVAEPIAQGEPARESPRRHVAQQSFVNEAMLDLARHMLDPSVAMAGDDGAEWRRIRIEEERERRRIDDLIDQAIREHGGGSSPV